MFDFRKSKLNCNKTLAWSLSADFDIDSLVPIEKIAFSFLYFNLGFFQKYFTLDM